MPSRQYSFQCWNWTAADDQTLTMTLFFFFFISLTLGSALELWMWLVIEVRSDTVKSNIDYEPGMSGPWIEANWKWSNEMARVNVDILGISQLKWTGMGEFNSDGHYIYYCKQESLRRNGVAIMVNKRLWNAVLGCNLKKDRMISVHLQGKQFNIRVIQAYATTSNAKEAEVEWFYEELQDLLELTPPKRCVFH